MIRKGDTVTIKPQWQDKGDSNYTWIALTDEEKGRLDITTVERVGHFQPRWTVTIDMLD